MSEIVKYLINPFTIVDNFTKYLEYEEINKQNSEKTKNGDNGCLQESLLKLKQLESRKFLMQTGMTREVFENLLALCTPYLKRTLIRESISPEQRLALTLLYLSLGCSMQSLACKWKLEKETARMVIYDTCDVLWTVLAPIYVSEPSESELQVISNDFWSMWNMPNCVGAIDGKHIANYIPPNTVAELNNYKIVVGSVVLMAACDAKYKFTYVDVGAYGLKSDDDVFNASSFGKRILSNGMPIPPPKRLPNTNLTLPHFFVADAAFPLTPNIMKGYPGVSLPASKDYFNKRISRARRVIENSFGILVARWRILLKPLYMLPKNAEIVVLACVALHNFLIIHAQSQSYIPQHYADWEDGNNDVQDGLWRNEVENNLNSLRPPQNGHVYNRSTSNRDELCSFVNNFPHYN